MTENGWPACGADQLDRTPIPGIDIGIPLQRGQPSTIMKAFAADYHLFIESLYNSRGGTDEGGWTPTNSVATSNHLGGTAMDLNWNNHAFQVKDTFSRDQQNTIDELLDYYEGTIYWGGHWNNPIDEMHWQMGYDTYRNPKTQDFIDRKIRSDGFSFFRKADDTPRIDRKPVVPGPGGTNWADISQYQGRPVNDHYPHSIICFRTNSGDKADDLAGENAAAALRGLAANAASIVIPYYFFRPGEANCDLHRQILIDHGLWLHPHTITMVDVESAGGTISGDQSAEVNDEINRLRGWYGNTRRVIGYWNPNADSVLWLRRPYGLNLVIPQYNNHPGDLTRVKDEIARREAFAHQYTDKAQDVAPWSGQNIDMNWSPYSIAELAELFGMESEIKAPGIDTAQEETLPADSIRKINEIHAELTKRFPSRSIYRTPGEGVVDTAVGFSLNQDAMLHMELTERLATEYGDSDAIERIVNTASGHGADPTDLWAITHAKDVLQHMNPDVLAAWMEKQKTTKGTP